MNARGLTYNNEMKMVELLAEKFFHAFYNHQWPGGDCAEIGSLSIEEAYEVQDIVAQLRINAGEELVGYKVGCTSTAIRSQFGLAEPIRGRIFQPHVFGENARIDWSNYVNCAIEPEMVFKIGKELDGANPSDDELIDSIEYVSPGIELHDFKFWHTPTTLQELICSGGIHAGLVVGNAKASPSDLNFKREVFSVYEGNRLVTSALASEIMGGPLRSLRWLVTSLCSQGLSLTKGSFVIPGSPVELVSIDHDTEMKVIIESIGSLDVVFRRRLPRSDN
jgi:2-keto-4-pentenoate hydratase